jgi:hypothetical protein
MSQHVVLSPHVIGVIDVSCGALEQAGVGHCMLRTAYTTSVCIVRAYTMQWQPD